MNAHDHYLKTELQRKIQEDPSIFDFLESVLLDGIWYWDLENPAHEWMSPRFWLTLGYDPQTKRHLASEWQDLIHPDDLQVAKENLEKHCADPSHPYDQVVRYRHRDGSTVWVRCRGLAIRDAEGRPVRLLGAHTELTAQKRAEQALRESEHLLQRIFEFLPVGMWFADRQGKLIKGNPAGIRIWGAEPRVGMAEYGVFKARRLPSGEEILPDDWALARTIREGTVVTDELLEIDAFDGSKKAILNYTAPVWDEEGRIDGAVIVNLDVTERIKAEEALRQSEERFRRIFENSVVGLFESTPAGRFVNVNRAFADMLGYDSPEDLVSSISDIATQYYANPEDRRRYQRLLMEKGTVENFEFEVRRKDGTSMWVSNSTRAYFDAAGKVVRYEGIVGDISERKKAEEDKEKLQTRLLHAQKMEAIGTLAGGIAHDFNNILSSIIGFTELAMDDVPVGSSTLENLQEVYSAGKRARELVRQILTFSRQNHMKPRAIRLKPIVEDALRFLRSTVPASIEIRKRLDSSAFIMADPAQLHQILLNLCTNAAQAMEAKGGILEVLLEEKIIGEESGSDPLDLAPGRYARICVSDTGPGIPAGALDFIFEPYFTTKGVGEGTGLGLAVVHGIVRQYKGNISVESESGKGARFIVHLPVVQGREAVTAPTTETLPVGDERLLIVEDEEPIARMLRKLLGGLGYEVTAKTDSREALELFRSDPGAFDLVITDMTMPHMDGDRLARELLEVRPDLPIILCTGYSRQLSEEKARATGIKAFAWKPLDRAAIARTIRNLLDEPSIGMSPERKIDKQKGSTAETEADSHSLQPMEIRNPGDHGHDPQKR